MGIEKYTHLNKLNIDYHLACGISSFLELLIINNLICVIYCEMG